MENKSWLAKPSVAFAAAVLLTGLVLWESVCPPWAPYFTIYAILGIAIPLLAQKHVFSWSGILAVFRQNWKILIGFFILLELWDLGSTWVCQNICENNGVGEDPNFSVNAALLALAGKAGDKFGFGSNTALALYGGFILIWAPIGEELFYRGYLQKSLSRLTSVGFAIAISAFFFGIRHATHFFFLWPEIAWVPALSWAFTAGVWGAIMGWMYEETKSLYPCVLFHFLGNLIAFSIG